MTADEWSDRTAGLVGFEASCVYLIRMRHLGHTRRQNGSLPAKRVPLQCFGKPAFPGEAGPAGWMRCF